MNALVRKSLRAGYRHARAVSRHAGLSLVELMVAITIGLLLVLGITTLITQQSSASNELSKSSQQIENGRYAMQLLQDDIELAGYYGEYYNLAAAPATMPDACATAAADLDAAIPLPIQGYDSPSTIPDPLSACLSDANHVAGTDILVIRRTDTTSIPIASAAAGQVYLQSGLDVSLNFSKVMGTGSDTTVFTLKKKDGSLAPLRKYLVDIYYVSPCNVPASGSACTGSSDDNGKPVPTLKRMQLSVSGGAPAFAVTPLVEGIQNLQLDYGIDTDSDGAPDYYTSGTYQQDGATALTTADWANIVTIRINLLARNNETSVGYVDKKTYNLGNAGTVGAFNDGYKRHLFSGIVRVVNPSGRKAK
ncbi:PilW family protein [Noviherbaspirillum sp. UKPF54]|uniref:PilW family protein n=1 Tax=Noviherbaspirillum sp. UKPF54 TaxID=2601898 RepID=UPI0011B112BD|nr:PilW family protein [Noviherbaspirillum sp. UKPF54]QDZ27208.1 pilus assembly protein PilW [Noviherbaspirillum sp. UKPF54]